MKLKLPHPLFQVGVPVFLEDSQTRGVVTVTVEREDGVKSYVVKREEDFVATVHSNVQPVH